MHRGIWRTKLWGLSQVPVEFWTKQNCSYLQSCLLYGVCLYSVRIHLKYLILYESTFLPSTLVGQSVLVSSPWFRQTRLEFLMLCVRLCFLPFGRARWSCGFEIPFGVSLKSNLFPSPQDVPVLPFQSARRILCDGNSDLALCCRGISIMIHKKSEQLGC